MSIFSKIDTKQHNNQQCYKIEMLYSPNSLFQEDEDVTIYFDRETGLETRLNIGTDTIIDYNYEFNIIRDEDLKEPNISEYKIQQNN